MTRPGPTRSRRRILAGSGAARGAPAGSSSAPAVIILGLFLVHPGAHGRCGSASRDWNGPRQPVRRPTSSFVGLENYADVPDRRRARRARLRHRRCATTSTTCCSSCRCRRRWRCSSPCWSTARMLRGRGFFRTAFYFPSVTSSVAITMLWLFLFSTSGAVNAVLGVVRASTARTGSHDPRGVLHLALGERRRRRSRPAALDEPASSASPGGTGSPGRPSRCARFILMAVFTTSRHVHAALPRRAAEHRRRARARRR